MSHCTSLLFFTLYCLFCINCILVAVQGELNKTSSHRFKTTAMAVVATKTLQKIFKEKNITCDNYDLYCSQLIESSPNLKTQPDVYQSNCEEKLKPRVCTSTNISTSTETSDTAV